MQNIIINDNISHYKVFQSENTSKYKNCFSVSLKPLKKANIFLNVRK